ncbi:Uncharacterized protein OBRU01_27212, partial [Operophtera brumata]
AELVAVEGKEIETHYVLARERIRKWNSTSKCYLLCKRLVVMRLSPTPPRRGDKQRQGSPLGRRAGAACQRLGPLP